MTDDAHVDMVDAILANLTLSPLERLRRGEERARAYRDLISHTPKLRRPALLRMARLVACGGATWIDIDAIREHVFRYRADRLLREALLRHGG